MGTQSDGSLLRRLTGAGSGHDAQVWPQLGHASAWPISRVTGPSALDLEGMPWDELPPTVAGAFAQAASHAQAAGFTGVEVHAGHVVLLSQFLSPLVNHRTDRYGGSIEALREVLPDVVHQIRAAVGPELAIAVKINSSDQLESGPTEEDAPVAVSLLGHEELDLIDISGGTYSRGWSRPVGRRVGTFSTSRSGSAI